VALLAAGGVALAYPFYLSLMFRSANWILDTHGRPSVSGFLVFWETGRAVLRGAAASAYDPRILHAAEVAAAGHEFTRHMSWQYPPLFFFVAAGLALLPYVPAFLFWIASTLAVYGLVVWRIAGSRLALVLACAAPAVFINAIGGQNGPLTAALIGTVLLNLEKRPVASGIALGLLTYRPQFGLLFPLVLAAGGYWRAFFAAAATAVLGILACWMAFGADALGAFLHFLPKASNALLVNGDNGFNNLQSVYGVARWLGMGATGGWIVQGSAILWTVVALVWLWRRNVPFEIKAAALATATLLATPYVYIYDFTTLTVTFAFLYRQRRFDSLEMAGIVAANLCVGAFLFFPTPIGLLAIAIVLGLMVRRVVQADKILPAASECNARPLPLAPLALG